MPLNDLNNLSIHFEEEAEITKPYSIQFKNGWTVYGTDTIWGENSIKVKNIQTHIPALNMQEDPLRFKRTGEEPVF